MKASTIMAAAAVVVLSFFISIGILNQSGASAQTPAAQGLADYIVVLRDTVPNADSEVDGIERAQAFRARLRFRTALKGFAAQLTPSQVQAIQRLPWVEFVSPDYEVHAVGPVPLQSGDSAPSGIRRIEAATTTTTREASNVNVAVIDTGVDLGHPDLNVVAGKNCVSSSAQPQDDNGHGTHVAGTIGAKNNGSGVVGAAPGTTLYAVKVLNASGSGTWSQVICGIDWVTANAGSLNIKVANMSVGGGGSNDNNCGNINNDALHRAICNSTAAGVTYVVAAGNDNANLAGFVPAAYPEVLTVTAMSDSDGQGGGAGVAPTCRSGELDDRYASFSSYAVSSSEIDHTIAGPGVCIYSTWVTVTTSGSWWNRTTTYTHTYTTISGTSMATPHVAGSVALCIGDGGTAGPCAGMTPAQIIQKMRSDAQARSSTPGYGFTGDPNNPVSGRYYGHLVANTTTPPAPDFTVSASPSSQTVARGSDTSYTVTVTGLNGYTDPVTLSVLGAPAGVTSTFVTNPVTPDSDGASTTLNISTTGATPVGSHTLTIRGSDGSVTHDTSVTLEVVAPDFTIAATPSSRTVTVGGSTSYTVTVTGLDGYTTPVNLSVTGAPSGVSASFAPNPVTPTSGGAPSTLNISTTTGATTGTFTLQITGSDGTLTHSTNVTLVVNPVPAGDFTMSVSPTSRSVFRFFGSTSTTYTVTLGSVSGYNSPVTLSVSGLATGMTPSFTPNPVTPTSGGATSTLRITVSSGAPRGTRTLTVTGLGSDGTSHSVNVTLTVR